MNNREPQFNINRRFTWKPSRFIQNTEPSTTILKDKDKDKLLDGSGVTLEATIPDPTIRIGADQEIAHLLNHVFLLKMITPWILPPLSAKQQTTKNVRNTKRRVDASNVENKATLFAIIPTKRHTLAQLAPSKLKTTRNQPLLNPPPHLHLSLHK